MASWIFFNLGLQEGSALHSDFMSWSHFQVLHSCIPFGMCSAALGCRRSQAHVITHPSLQDHTWYDQRNWHQKGYMHTRRCRFRPQSVMEAPRHQTGPLRSGHNYCLAVPKSFSQAGRDDVQSSGPCCGILPLLRCSALPLIPCQRFFHHCDLFIF